MAAYRYEAEPPIGPPGSAEPGDCGVLPVDDLRTARFAEERPQIAVRRTSSAVCCGTRKVPTSVAVIEPDRPHSITADVDVQ